jgi:hypothetical protein
MKVRRRRFLQGIGGAMVALPFLESVVFTDSKARAGGTGPVYSVFFKNNNGFAVASGGEPERFWPHETGPITPELLRTRDADRAVSELADYGDKLVMVRGMDYGFRPTSCGHAGGSVQSLTGARIVIPEGLSGHDSVAAGESIDYRIGREFNRPGTESLYLVSGAPGNYFAGPSFSGPMTARASEHNPLAVYTDLMGLSGLGDDIAMRIAQRRTSVNDLVRDQMRDLLGDADLGSADRRRLSNHFEAIRETELVMACELGGADVDAMREIDDAAHDNGNRVRVAEMFMDITALVFACDLNRSVLVQMGGKTSDSTRYMVDGVLQNTFHKISHRLDSDGDLTDCINAGRSEAECRIPDADVLHHKIDRIMAGVFRYLLDRLSMHPGPSGGTLLDDCIAAWTNELASGPPHSTDNVPWILAGSGGGFLRQGVFVEANTTHNKILNTILSAHGLRNESGGYFDSFGDSSLERGVIDGIIA